MRHAPRENRAIHVAENLHSALPIAIVILTLLALLSWEFYHYAQAFADKAAQAMAGPWA